MKRALSSSPHPHPPMPVASPRRALPLPTSTPTLLPPPSDMGLVLLVRSGPLRPLQLKPSSMSRLPRAR